MAPTATVPPDIIGERVIHGGHHNGLYSPTISYVRGNTGHIIKAVAPSSPISSDEGSSSSKENDSIIHNSPNSNNIPVITSCAGIVNAYQSQHPSVVVSRKPELLQIPTSLYNPAWSTTMPMPAETSSVIGEVKAQTMAYAPFAIASPATSPIMQGMSGINRKKKRQPQPTPDSCKDDAYWERRKRNNESAKRSREVRRMKEHETSLRVIVLENDNIRLRTEVNMLRSELDKLRQMLCNQHMGRT